MEIIEIKKPFRNLIEWGVSQAKFLARGCRCMSVIFALRVILSTRLLSPLNEICEKWKIGEILFTYTLQDYIGIEQLAVVKSCVCLAGSASFLYLEITIFVGCLLEGNEDKVDDCAQSTSPPLKLLVSQPSIIKKTNQNDRASPTGQVCSRMLIRGLVWAN